MALFCRRAEQMSSSQGGRNSWWLARSSAMVLGEPGEDLCSPSPSWQPSSMESTSKKRDCWGGFTLRRGRRTFFPFFLSKIQFSALYRTVSEQLTADNTGLMVNARRVSAPCIGSDCHFITIYFLYNWTDNQSRWWEMCCRKIQLILIKFW